MKLDQPVVVLAQIEPGEPLPDHCVHGRATCIVCHAWCWLGSATYDVVFRGEALPICQECAGALMPPDTQPVKHIRDHRRVDGPHS